MMAEVVHTTELLECGHAESPHSDFTREEGRPVMEPIRQVTFRECADQRWSATYEEVLPHADNPLDFACGDTQLDAGLRLMERCPAAGAVTRVHIVRLSEAWQIAKGGR